jgi:hypothetical protein
MHRKLHSIAYHTPDANTVLCAGFAAMALHPCGLDLRCSAEGCKSGAKMAYNGAASLYSA